MGRLLVMWPPIGAKLSIREMVRSWVQIPEPASITPEISVVRMFNQLSCCELDTLNERELLTHQLSRLLL